MTSSPLIRDVLFQAIHSTVCALLSEGLDF